MRFHVVTAAVCGLIPLSTGCSVDTDGAVHSASTSPSGLPIVALDGDGDGFPGGVDCNDSDASIHPGAIEVIDGVDQECDGHADAYSVCPGNYATIGAAITAAPSGLLIRICAGTYFERLTIAGKSLTFDAVSSATDTIVDAGLLGTAFKFSSGPGVSEIRDLTVKNGNATEGGGVACTDTSVTLTGTVLSGNKAVNGAGLNGLRCGLTVTGATIKSNTATFQGGGILSEDGDLVVTGSTVEANKAAEGGGIYFEKGEDDTTITGNTIKSNIATQFGGGIWGDGQPLVDDNVISYNTASSDGGGMYFNTSEGTVTNNRIERNTTGNDGGGMYTNFGALFIANNEFLYNTAADDAGAARLRKNYSTFQDNWIEGNTAGDDGGGVKSCHTDNDHIRNTYVGNSAVDQGGGLEVDNESSHVIENVFLYNTAVQGAGLDMHTNLSPQEVVDSEFRGNIATDKGGGINTKKNPFLITIRHAWMEDNEAKNGGAIYAYSPVTVENSVIIHNVGTSGGGGIYARQYGGTLRNLVLDSNTSPSGAGIKFNGWPGVGTNLAITNNIDGKGVTATGVLPVAWTYNNVWNNTLGGYNTTMGDREGIDGNIDADPLYLGGLDFHVQGGSPMVDAGDPAVLDTNGTRSDMGAFGGPLGVW